MIPNHFKIIDLTHPLSPSIPTWSGSCGFCVEVKRDYDQEFCVQKLKMHAGIGTHMDAPSHRFPGKSSIADIALENLIVPACVIDVSDKSNPNYEISVLDIERYESSYGKIPKGSLVIGYTGWSKFWETPSLYRNEDETGKMHFPAFSSSAAELLLSRNIAGIAIEFQPACNFIFLLSAGFFVGVNTRQKKDKDRQ